MDLVAGVSGVLAAGVAVMVRVTQQAAQVLGGLILSHQNSFRAALDDTFPVPHSADKVLGVVLAPDPALIGILSLR